MDSIKIDFEQKKYPLVRRFIKDAWGIAINLKLIKGYQGIFYVKEDTDILLDSVII